MIRKSEIEIMTTWALPFPKHLLKELIMANSLKREVSYLDFR